MTETRLEIDLKLAPSPKHVWSQGPGPWPNEAKWPDDVDAYCGLPVRRSGKWVGVSAVTAELLQHRAGWYEDDRLCEDCLRGLASRPIARCPCLGDGGVACRGQVACHGEVVRREIRPCLE